MAPYLGPRVSELQADLPNTFTSLKGTYVTLEPISPAHIDSLWTHLDLLGKGDHLLDFLPWQDPTTPEELWTLLKSLRDDRGFCLYAVKVDPKRINPIPETNSDWSHSEAVGIIAYSNISTIHRELEVGGVVFSAVLQRTVAATEAFYLMLRNASVATPAYRRIAWKCHTLNEPSLRAAERLGFTWEGTFRNHLIIRGYSRDSHYLSIIDAEWPVVGMAFEQWLQRSNFDEKGKQIRSLVDIRASCARA